MPGRISIRDVTRSFGSVVAVDHVSLEIAEAEFITLLGPSGCGKTTLLRLIAGFEIAESGSIAIDGADVTAVPPYRRRVNTVFQHYALFPHRTVAGNIAFGLEVAGAGKDEIARRIRSMLELVRLTGLEDRRVDALSGGQRQRVALARALVLEPDVLLLDEPMAALDSKLRKEMQVELKNLQETLGITFVFVTHDQDEALVMSDRIAVMNHGRIEQVDGPEPLYEKPRTRFVAEFMGVPNLLRVRTGRNARGTVQVMTASGLSLEVVDDGQFLSGQETWVGVRSEAFQIGDSGPNALHGVIDDEVYLGDWTEWLVRIGDDVIRVAEGARTARDRRRGDAITVSCPPDAVLRLDDLGDAAP
jgi:spermidine/putrescine transport system ATP-binding protein